MLKWSTCRGGQVPKHLILHSIITLFNILSTFAILFFISSFHGAPALLRSTATLETHFPFVGIEPLAGFLQLLLHANKLHHTAQEAIVSAHDEFEVFQLDLLAAVESRMPRSGVARLDNEIRGDLI